MFDEFVIMAALLKLGYAAVAITLMVWLSARLDHRAGIPFADTMAGIRRSSVATGLYFGLRFIALAIVVGMLLGCAPAAASIFPAKYDREIKRSVETWWPDYPSWAAWKGQLYQESRLDPAAVSPVGAAGLAQFMPGTWAQIARELRLPAGVSPHHEIAIEAGAYYMAKLRRQWSAPRPADDRQRLAQASYNAGLGHLLAAQRACGGPPLYSDIIACLPAITGRHSRETIAYVKRIAKWRAMIEAGL